MHFHELRFWKFAEGWWWRRGTLLENSTRASAGWVVQSPAMLVRVLEGSSALSLHLTFMQRVKEMSSMLPPAGGQRGWLGEERVWEREDFPGGAVLLRLQSRTQNGLNSENKKIGGCLFSQYHCACLPFGLSCPIFDSHSNQAPTMLPRQLVCIS